MTIRNMTWLSLTLAACTFGCQPADKPVEATPPASEPAAAAPVASPPAAEAPPAAPAVASLTRVADPSLICMVTNQFMGRPQIPIEADGRTYYGCCEMCKGRLANDPSSRVATDPVSQRQVDKSVAVIGMTADGGTVYFESEQNFAAYTAGAP